MLFDAQAPKVSHRRDRTWTSINMEILPDAREIVQVEREGGSPTQLLARPNEPQHKQHQEINWEDAGRAAVVESVQAPPSLLVGDQDAGDQEPGHGEKQTNADGSEPVVQPLQTPNRLEVGHKDHETGDAANRVELGKIIMSGYLHGARRKCSARVKWGDT